MKKNNITRDFKKLIQKNTKILKIEKQNQLSFLFKKPHITKNTDQKSYFEKLLNCYILTFFSDKMLNHWKCELSNKKSFNSLFVTFLLSFKTINNNRKHVELFYAKISFLNNTRHSWEVFRKDVLKTINQKYNFDNIEDIHTFKIVINFDPELIEYSNFISGKLVCGEYDKHNRLRFSIKKNIPTKINWETFKFAFIYYIIEIEGLVTCGIMGNHWNHSENSFKERLYLYEHSRMKLKLINVFQFNELKALVDFEMLMKSMLTQYCTNRALYNEFEQYTVKNKNTDEIINEILIEQFERMKKDKNQIGSMCPLEIIKNYNNSLYNRTTNYKKLRVS